MIYLLEDDDNIRKLVCYALSKEGFEVQGHSSPKEFWQGLNTVQSWKELRLRKERDREG